MTQCLLVWRLATFRAAPQDFPVSPALLTAFCFLMAVSGVVSAKLANVPERMWIDAGVELAFTLVFVYVLLLLFRCPERFPQTMTALAGISALFNVILMPLNYLAVQMSFGEAPAGVSTPPFSAVMALVYLGIFIWIVRVIGHIMLHALEVRLSFAVGIALLYMAGNLVLSLSIHV
ncbi:MAG: hypothetical protein OXU83_06525 [Gammaproteobacteria bacterium]|nr:hypothetical protein [Gammaproteobacteria bacterium]MDD9886795.1 hypothetical protein [Gammaproteobacteria bacterium]